jgi:hypothetical protein
MKNLAGLCLVLLLTLTAAAQIPEKESIFSMGISVGRCKYSGNSTWYVLPDNSYSPHYNSYSNPLYFLGLSIDYKPFESLRNFSVYTRIIYSDYKILGDVAGSGNQHVLTDESGNKTYFGLSTMYNMEVDYNLINVDFIMKYDLYGFIGICVGPSIGIVPSNHNKQVYSIVNPVNIKFKDITDWQANERPESSDGRSVTIYDGSMKEINYFRFGISFGLQYDYIISDIIITPFAGMNFGLNDILSNPNYGKQELWIARGGVDIRYAF